MKYYLIVGEASGDLHASHLMKALLKEDPEAEFRFFGGDLLQPKAVRGSVRRSRGAVFPRFGWEMDGGQAAGAERSGICGQKR